MKIPANRVNRGWMDCRCIFTRRGNRTAIRFHTEHTCYQGRQIPARTFHIIYTAFERNAAYCIKPDYYVISVLVDRYPKIKNAKAVMVYNTRVKTAVAWRGEKVYGMWRRKEGSRPFFFALYVHAHVHYRLLCTPADDK